MGFKHYSTQLDYAHICAGGPLRASVADYIIFYGKNSDACRAIFSVKMTDTSLEPNRSHYIQVNGCSWCLSCQGSGTAVASIYYRNHNTIKKLPINYVSFINIVVGFLSKLCILKELSEQNWYTVLCLVHDSRILSLVLPKVQSVPLKMFICRTIRSCEGSDCSCRVVIRTNRNYIYPTTWLSDARPFPISW